MTAITPPSAGTAEERLDAAADERLSRVPATIPATAWSADDIPEEYLAVLAWAHSLDEWNPDWERRDPAPGDPRRRRCAPVEGH